GGGAGGGRRGAAGVVGAGGGAALQPRGGAAGDRLRAGPLSKEEGLTLFRERHGWCPYSERVWLALEAKGLRYETVLIDNTGPGRKPRWWGGSTPQVRWADGRTQKESLDIVRKLDAEYPESPQLWPDEEVTRLVDAFRDIFPKGTRPSSRAAFLFSGYGDMPVWRSEFEKTLTKTDELLGKHGGPFFYGARLTAADVAWAPFLERYSEQLPCLHAGLDPRDPGRWPRLSAWYEAMMDRVPAYPARLRQFPPPWQLGTPGRDPLEERAGCRHAWPSAPCPTDLRERQVRGNSLGLLDN
ncbi:unnamed protein product, partial [Prorocentrum cordatum]